jgi:hypothetical protein
VSGGGVGRAGGRPRQSIFRPKEHSDMQGLPAITSSPRSELTSRFHGAIQGLWSLGSTNKNAPHRVRVAVRLAGRLAVRLGGRLELLSKLPLCPRHRAFRALAFCRHLYVAPKSVSRLDIPRTFSLSLSVRRARRSRPLLRAGCSASSHHRLAAACRLGGGGVVGHQRTTPRESRRGRGCARSARVLAVRRRGADLDRFVAALLALASEPGCDSSRPRRTSARKARRR